MESLPFPIGGHSNMMNIKSWNKIATIKRKSLRGKF